MVKDGVVGQLKKPNPERRLIIFFLSPQP